MTSTNPTEQDLALRAASFIFGNAYGAALSADGAYERIQEKICDMCRGVKTRRENFISTEAIIHVMATHPTSRKTSFEEAKHLYYSKSPEERKKIRGYIKGKDMLWEAARKFDLTNHRGQKFVVQSRSEVSITFSLIDGRSLFFDLNETLSTSKGFKNLYRKLVLEGRKQIPIEDISEIEMGRIVSDQISDVTRWDKKLISQALEQFSSTDKSLLYAYLQPGSLRKVEKKINKPHNKVFVQDVVLAIEIVIGDLEDGEAR
jgi:type III secretory pathway component EscV